MHSIGAMVLVAVGVAAASPAWAGETAAAPVVIALAAAPSASVAMVGDQLADLPTVAFATAATPAKPTLAAIRKGFGMSTTSFYPLKDSGFHFTAGTRVSTRTLAGKTVDAPWDALLWSPRGSGLRSQRRMSPVAFVGFDRPVGDGMTLGFDAGAAKGRLNSFARGPRAAMEGGSWDRGHGEHGGQGLNPLARMTFAYRF